MGFGLYLLFIFILVPLTTVLLVIWVVSRKLIVGKILACIWIGLFGLVMLSLVFQWLTSKTVLDKEDYYGEYVINRDYFKGEQADWQYNHFRFEITENDSILFYVTDDEEIVETYRGTIETTNPNHYESVRLKINMEGPIHHILSSNPTTYRSAWEFYLVFDSPKFHNVFFKKGTWKSLE